MLVQYNGRLVDSDNFRVVLHHKDGLMRVAEGWHDYQRLLKSEEWFEKRPIVSRETLGNKRRRKAKAANDDNGS